MIYLCVFKPLCSDKHSLICPDKSTTDKSTTAVKTVTIN